MTEAEELRELRALATILVKKLDVAMPDIDGIIGFQSGRSGGQQVYFGPNLGDEIEGLRTLLDLPTPAAHPREFYPEGYCKTCDGEGKVLGGEGLPDHTTRMNMQRMVVAVKDEEAARELLESLNEPEIDEKFASLPFNLNRVGQREIPSVGPNGEHGTAKVPNPPGKDADLSMFEIEVRRWDWDSPPERKWKDICPQCKGTGDRGLPVQDFDPLGMADAD